MMAMPSEPLSLAAACLGKRRSAVKVIAGVNILVSRIPYVKSGETYQRVAALHF